MSDNNSINSSWYMQSAQPAEQPARWDTKSVRTNYVDVPSIIANQNFDAKASAELLRKAMTGSGSDKSMAILQPLISCNNAQRQEVGVIRQTKFCILNSHNSFTCSSKCTADLVSELKTVSGEFQELITAMMVRPKIYDAEQLNRALKACEMGTPTDHFIYSFFHFRDAHKLWRTGAACLGTKEIALNCILAGQNFAQLQLVAFGILEKKILGDIYDAHLALIKCILNRPAYFAQLIKKGLGTSDNDLLVGDFAFSDPKNQFFIVWSYSLRY
ncbi:hypothetical protein GPALN_007825 [Globodera pallida]|nr:hypothetical protein GPALN_007825 [Globodera pallida]